MTLDEIKGLLKHREGKKITANEVTEMTIVTILSAWTRPRCFVFTD